MCDVARRDFLAAGAATFLSAAAERELLAGSVPVRVPPPGAQEVATGVFFYVSESPRMGSNSGWVIFDDYVLVIDTTYPAGAREVIRAVRTTTDKPIRFAFDTHHHGDHAYGNQVYADQGATAVAMQVCSTSCAAMRRGITAAPLAAGRTRPGPARTSARAV
jgi:glyoxylase-like metal-dependent hydrolase (beta-lactamase superfamily II)